MFFYILETMSEKKGEGKKPDAHGESPLAGPAGPPLAGAGGPTIAGSATVRDE
jgi:multidrug efflux pump